MQERSDLPDWLAWLGAGIMALTVALCAAGVDRRESYLPAGPDRRLEQHRNQMEPLQWTGRQSNASRSR